MYAHIQKIIEEKLKEKLRQLSEEVENEARCLADSIAWDVRDAVIKQEWLKEREDDGSGFANRQEAMKMLGVRPHVFKKMEYDGCIHRISKDGGSGVRYRVSEIENARKYVNGYLSTSRTHSGKREN